MTIESQVTNTLKQPEFLTVTQLNQAVSHVLEEQLDVCWVRGEISNFTNASSGHWYFTLKDDSASVRAVMFRGRAATTGFTPKAGDSVELKARVTLYEARGEYQLQVEQLRLQLVDVVDLHGLRDEGAREGREYQAGADGQQLPRWVQE